MGGTAGALVVVALEGEKRRTPKGMDATVVCVYEVICWCGCYVCAAVMVVLLRGCGRGLDIIIRNLLGSIKLV